MGGAQLIVLGDFVHFDIGLDADLAPHADDGLDHLVVFWLEAARGLYGEAHGFLWRVAAGLQQGRSLRRVVRHFDRRVEGFVFRRFKRCDRDAVAAQQALDDGGLVDCIDCGEADVLVEHLGRRVGNEDHPDVANRRRHAGNPALGPQAVVVLVGDFERHIGRPAFDFRHAAGCVGDEFEDDGVEGGLTAPVMRIGRKAEIGVTFIGVHLVGAGANRILLKPVGTHFFIIGFRQHIAGEERHPFEQRRIIRHYVCGDAVAVHLVVGDFRPKELDRVAAFWVSRAGERPNHILRREGRAVMPSDVWPHVHPDFAAIGAPAPGGEQAGLEGEVAFLANIIGRRWIGRSSEWWG